MYEDQDLYDEIGHIDGYDIIEIMDKYDEDYEEAVMRCKRIKAQRLLARERRRADDYVNSPRLYLSVE